MNSIVNEDIKSIVLSECNWDMFRGCNILITGATGLIAHYMVLALLMRNDLFDDKIKVIALCRNRNKAEALYKENFKRNDLTFLFQDVTEDIVYDEAIDYIIHAASPANTYMHVNDPYGTVSANVNGFQNILEKSRKDKVRKIMLFSSYMVYGPQASSHPLSENDACVVNIGKAVDVYSISKLLCEAMAKSSGKSVDIVRPSLIYGPGITASSKRHFSDFILKCINNEPIKLMSSGKMLRNYLYVSDAVKAFFQVLLSDREADTYNVVSDSTISVLQLAQIMAKQSNLDIIFDIENQKDYHNATYNMVSADNSKIKQLGWTQKIAIEEGVQRTINWARNEKFFVKW